MMPTPTVGTMGEGSTPQQREFGPNKFYDCTVDTHECLQPPPPFVFPSHLNDDDSD
jgi:hypothetical protein